jgi:hypothetical protein
LAKVSHGSKIPIVRDPRPGGIAEQWSKQSEQQQRTIIIGGQARPADERSAASPLRQARLPIELSWA